MFDKVSELIKQAEQGYVVGAEGTNEEHDTTEVLLRLGNLGTVILSQILIDYQEYLDTGKLYGAYAFGIFLEEKCGFDFSEILIAAGYEIELKTGALNLLIYKNTIIERCNKSSENEEYLNLLNLCLFLGGIVENFNYLIILSSLGGVF